MENLKNIIESKKLKSSDKKPRYATRKLSVGLVSCMLGYFVFMSPTVVNAQTVEVESDTTTAVSESVDKPQKAEVNESSEAASVSVDKEVAEKNTEVEERKEATTNAAVENEENTLEKKTEAVANSEEITNKEEAAKVSKIEPNEATENKSSEVADAEEAAKAVEEKEETVSAKENKDEKEVENKDVATENAGDLEVAAEEKEALGISEEIDPEAQTAEESKDISNNIINPRVSIRTENTTTPKTLDAGLGEQLTWGLSFTTPEGTKAGDTFTVKLSDNMSLKGLEPDTDYALPVKFGDKIIATAKRIDRQTIQYTFTKEINDLKYARVYIINSAQENREKVQETSDQTFKINVGEKAADEQNIKVDFGKIYEAALSSDVNGKSQFTEFNPEDGSFTQVFYLNPESKEISISSTSDQNGREYGKVGFLLSSPHDADKPRSVDYLENNTKIEVKKLPKGAKLPDAIIENPEGAQKATNVKGEFRKFKGKPMFTMNFGNGNKIDSPYVVVVKGHANKIDGKYTNLYSNGTLYGDGEASLFLDNLYNVQENSTDSEGVKETLGYFKEHHIYITKENGKETSRFEIPGATVSGTADEYYYTDKNDIPGYHFVKIGEGDNAPKYNPAYNDKGKITKGNFEVGKTKEVTYIYENDITTKGSFIEHHIYITKDQDGVETGRKEEDGKLQEGKKEETYKTGKVEKDGFEFVRTETPVNEPTFDEKGAETKGKYKPGVKQEITYVYEKTVNDPQKEPGSFIEHHIYITKDQDGVETGRKEDDGKLQEGKKDQSYTTGKIEKDGFEFVRTETPVNEPTFDEKGAETKGKYKPGVKQEITYVYEKTVNDPQKEPATPIKGEDPKEDPKKPNESTPLVPLTPAEPVEPNESTPPTRDHKTPGTPVVTEVPPTKVVEIEKTHEEKPEESKEVENKEEKVEVKEIEKEEAPELVSKEFVKDKGLEAQKKSYKAKDDNKAPKTSDAGILSSIGLSSLAASGLAFLELRKRNKKNK